MLHFIRKINCGALKLTSDELVVREVRPVRMATIKKTNTGEKKAMITETKFRGNITRKANAIIGISETSISTVSRVWFASV